MTANVTVIGVGRDGVPPGAGRPLALARLVVGAGSVPDAQLPGGADLVELPASGFDGSMVDDIGTVVRSGGPVVVLVPGDPGLFGGLRALRAAGLPVVVWPSVSDVARLAAMLKRPWDDVTVVDARGRGFRRAVNVCRARPAVAVLTGAATGPAELARELDGWHRYLAVLEGVGGDEELSIVDVTEAARRLWRGPNLVLCLNSLEGVGVDRWIGGGEPVPPAGGWALDDGAFATRTGVGIPAHVRAVALARLAPRPGDLVWDVCAGAGAVGVEAARMGAAVVAVERDAGLCVRIVANASAHGVDLRLEDGEPPRCLAGLPRPDAVFVGRAHPDVVSACAGAGAERVVVLVSEPDALGRVRATLRDAGYAVGGGQLASAALVDGPEGGTALAPAESAFLVWGVREAQG